MFSLTSIRRRNRAWLRRHSYSFFSSLGVLLQHKVGTSMTVLVLGIAMFLPLGLYVTLANLDGLNLHQDEWSAMTVYFASGTSQTEVRRVADELEKRTQAEKVVVISPAEGLVDFREASGFGESLDMLEENPLPWVMQVTPPPGTTQEVEASIAELTTYLQSIDSVEVTQFDYKWLKRLGRMLDLGQAAVSVLILLFGLAVVVVVANTPVTHLFVSHFSIPVSGMGLWVVYWLLYFCMSLCITWVGRWACYLRPTALFLSCGAWAVATRYGCCLGADCWAG